MTNSNNNEKTNNKPIYRMFLLLSVLSFAIFAMWSQLSLKPHYDYSKELVESKQMEQVISEDMMKRSIEIKDTFLLTPNNIEKVANWQIEMLSEVLASTNDIDFNEKMKRLNDAKELANEAKELHYEMWDLQKIIFLIPLMFLVGIKTSRYLRKK